MGERQTLIRSLSNFEDNFFNWERRLQSGKEGKEVFYRITDELRESLDEIGRSGFKRLAAVCEKTEDTFERDGRIYRFKKAMDRDWVTLWGIVRVSRRLYQEDQGGPWRVPLDECCGMENRFMVPILERLTAFLGPRLGLTEVQDCLKRILPEVPPLPAIRHFVSSYRWVPEDNPESRDHAIQGRTPLEAHGELPPTRWNEDPIVAYIQLNFSQITFRQEVADHFGVTAATVSNRVQKMVGASFTRFLHECKIKEAKCLLTDGVLPPTQIAFRVGFSTSQLFSRIFRNLTGISPSAYRKRHRRDP